jgi:hypothetical protein
MKDWEKLMILSSFQRVAEMMEAPDLETHLLLEISDLG